MFKSLIKALDLQFDVEMCFTLLKWQSECLKFLNRNRNVDRKDTEGKSNPESISEYLASLKHLTLTCQFTTGEYEDRLRDILLHGINDSDMQMEMMVRI